MDSLDKFLHLAPKTTLLQTSLAIAEDFERLRQSLSFPFAADISDFLHEAQLYEAMHYAAAPHIDTTFEAKRRNSRVEAYRLEKRLLTPEARLFHLLFTGREAPLSSSLSSSSSSASSSTAPPLYSRTTTMSLLFVASAYLGFPVTTGAEAIEFGIHLCAFFYFTQPDEAEYRYGELVTKERERAVRARRTCAFGEPYVGIDQSKAGVGAGAGAKSRRNNRDDDDDDDDDDDENQIQRQQQVNNTQNDEQDGDEIFYLVDRRARIPLAVDTALYLLELCNSGALSPAAQINFQRLKEHHAFILVPRVRYYDVAVWAVMTASSPSHYEQVENNDNNNSNRGVRLQQQKQEQNRRVARHRSLVNIVSLAAAAAADAAAASGGAAVPLDIRNNQNKNDQQRQQKNQRQNRNQEDEKEEEETLATLREKFTDYVEALAECGLDVEEESEVGDVENNNDSSENSENGNDDDDDDDDDDSEDDVANALAARDGLGDDMSWLDDF